MLHDVISGDRIKCPWLLSLAADFVAIAAAYYTTIALRFHCEWGAHFFTVFNQALGVRETADLPEPYEIFYLASGPRIVCSSRSPCAPFTRCSTCTPDAVS